MNTVGSTQFFSFEQSQIAYRVFGNGPTALLAFHGFGQNGAVFEPLAATRFTVYAIDLYYHGSTFVGNDLLTKSDWQRFIDAFLQAHRIDRFSLIGFSLGGRFALTLVEAFAGQLDQLLLIAPDGITRSFWYELATSTAAGRALFRYVLRHLPLLSYFGHRLVRLGLLNRTVMRFAEISLATPEQRTLVYQTWTQFRHIRPDLEIVSTQLIANPVRVRFFTGEFDRIVPGNYILPLTKRLRHYEVTVLKTGHNRLIELVAEKV
ncbi:alpha/beta hydrolase [Spirosoma montaniterrae]|uniref:Alpha/beta hydrolase n=2 Tax=Spirosoma montaniterrae TaxID=1178516 RepID=A0A1P9X289_9BACT|nr:alpha/beta hydrolase [Spirosoma montaniterrae]